MKNKTTVKTPPRGGDAAAAWEHNLKPDEKEELGRQYREAGERELLQGKKTVQIIAAVNAALAVVSFATGSGAMLMCLRLALSAALFFGLPGIRIIFPLGAAVSLYMIYGGWADPAGFEVFKLVFNITGSICLVISSIILLAKENVTEYLYAKRNG